MDHWPMFLEMHSEGSELGSHSLNHPHLLQLPVGDTLTPNTIHYELYQSKKMIEARTNFEQCITFAYPYAEHNVICWILLQVYIMNHREQLVYHQIISLYLVWNGIH
ncbi:MAG: polysaccharide deacetylase family protein [Ignavibacteriales bacterium]|nr:polysaccharide deacetylase family protein [Ignavibacteriales bacterium]